MRVFNFAISKKFHFAGIWFRDLVIVKSFTGIWFHDFSKNKKEKDHWMTIFLLLINVIVIKYVTETLISLSRDTGISIIPWSNIRKNRIIKLGRCQFRRYLVSRFFGFETFFGYKISRKLSKIAKVAKFSTREI